MSLVNIATGALLAKDLFGSKKSNRTSGTRKGGSKGLGTFGKIILAVGGAYVANKFIAGYSKSNVEDSAGTNTKDGIAASYAIRLYEAMFGGLFFGLGTDDAEIKAVATLVKADKNNELVIAKYRTLYGNSLNTDLQKDGVFNDYYNIINGTTTPTNTGGTKTRTFSVGATIYGFGGYNVRTINGAFVRSSVNMEEWQIVNWKTETLAGTKGVWVEVKKKGINIVTTYKIISKGLYFK